MQTILKTRLEHEETCYVLHISSSPWLIVFSPQSDGIAGCRYLTVAAPGYHTTSLRKLGL